MYLEKKVGQFEWILQEPAKSASARVQNQTLISMFSSSVFIFSMFIFSMFIVF